MGHTSGTKTRALKLVEDTEIYKVNPVVERVLNSLDSMAPTRRGTEQMKNTLLDLNIINQYKVSIKSDVHDTPPQVTDLDEVTSKINCRLYGTSF